MKGTTIWDKTTIVWSMGSVGGGNTNIPVTDWHEKEKKYFHRLQEMRIVSLNHPNENGERQALIELEIFRVSIAPSADRGKVISALMAFDKSVRGVNAKDPSPVFSIKYALGEGESFSDSAIDRARKMFRALGVSDDFGHEIANFIIFRESLVRVKNAWIPYDDYLRHKHGLKQVCTLWGRKIQIGDMRFSIDYKDAESNVFARFNG